MTLDYEHIIDRHAVGPIERRDDMAAACTLALDWISWRRHRHQDYLQCYCDVDHRDDECPFHRDDLFVRLPYRIPDDTGDPLDDVTLKEAMTNAIGRETTAILMRWRAESERGPPITHRTWTSDHLETRGVEVVYQVFQRLIPEIHSRFDRDDLVQMTRSLLTETQFDLFRPLLREVVYPDPFR